MSSKKQYRVIAPYVTLKTSRTLTGSAAILGFHEGATVPDDVSADSIAHHLARGLIVEIPPEAMPVAAPQGDAGDADPKHGGTPEPSTPDPAGTADKPDPAKADDAKADPHAGESKELGAGENPAPAGSQPGAKPASGRTTTTGRATPGGKAKAD